MNTLRSLFLLGLLAAGCGGAVEPSGGEAQGRLGEAPVAGSAGAAGFAGAAEVAGAAGVAGAGEAGGADGAGEEAPYVGGAAGGSGGSPGVYGPPYGGCGAGPVPYDHGQSFCGYEPSAVPAGFEEGQDPFADGSCPCTRRDGASAFCTTGDGVTYSAEVGPEGGVLEFPTLTFSGVPLRLKFPAGAVAATTEISVTAGGAPPVEFQDYSPLIRIEPAGLALAQPVGIDLGFELPYASGFVSSNLAIQVSSGTDCFAPIGAAHVNAGFVQGELLTLGDLFAGHLKPAGLQACP